MRRHKLSARLTGTRAADHFRLTEVLPGDRPATRAETNVSAPLGRKLHQAPAPDQRMRLEAGGVADMLEPDEGGISTTRCRVLLGEQALDLSDGEIDAIRQHADAMAQVLIEVLLTPRERRP